MLRGIIGLNTEERRYLTAVIADSGDSELNLFHQKIMSLENYQDEIADIQISENDLEKTLDLLPPPNTNDIVRALRLKLTTKLQEMRR